MAPRIFCLFEKARSREKAEKDSAFLSKTTSKSDSERSKRVQHPTKLHSPITIPGSTFHSVSLGNFDLNAGLYAV